jgi:hypothetical protein
MYGGDRDFYPNTQNVLVTVDQTLQDTNHGYTGDVNPVSYSRIAENSSYNTEFLTEFFCQKETRRKGFSMPSETPRDLITGLRCRIGPIIKLIELKIYFCLYILQGCWLLEYDRTLVAGRRCIC